MTRALLLCISIAYCSFFYAQVSDPVFTLKPSVGLSGCQVHGDTYAGFDKMGAFGGIAVNARTGKRTSLELGFYFAQKGSRHNPNPEKGDFDYYRLNMNCIDMPLSVRYQVKSAYFITLGPYLSYLINHRENINYADRTNDYVYNKFELGLNLGVGRKLGNKFSVELRTTNSLTPVRTFQNNTYYPNAVARFFNRGYYNNILTLFVAYHIDLKKHAKA